MFSSTKRDDGDVELWRSVDDGDFIELHEVWSTGGDIDDDVVSIRRDFIGIDMNDDVSDFLFLLETDPLLLSLQQIY